MRVIVAGAGIGGLTAALALARIGAHVVLLERADVLADVGAGVQLSPNATRVLARFDLLDEIAAKASAPTAIAIRSAATGRTLARVPLSDASRRWGAPYLVVRRADLQAVLVAAAAAEPSIELHLGTSLAGFGVTTSGVTVTAMHRQIKRSLTGDALIGADGIRSLVRTRLAAGASDAPQETGRTAWRAMVPSASVPSALKGTETSLWLGRNAHLVHYAVGGAMMNVVAVTRDSARAAPDDWSRPGDPLVLDARFADWHPDARALIVAAPDWTTWPLFDRAPLAAWNAGPVALLGDAAHPILPFFAQGAAQAIEDAAALAAALAGTRDIPAGLAAYSAARRSRATRVQVTSRELGRIYHLSGPAKWARDLVMRSAGPRRLLTRYDWVYAG